MWGMVLSYLAVTTTRISHNAFVSFNKGGKEWCQLMRLAPELVQHNFTIMSKITLLTLSTPHTTIVDLSHLVEKVASLELLHDTEFSVRLV